MRNAFDKRCQNKFEVIIIWKDMHNPIQTENILAFADFANFTGRFENIISLAKWLCEHDWVNQSDRMS